MPHSTAARFAPAALCLLCGLFALLALLNSGGYRYGASDQAFYIPAIEHHLDPGLFPRDWALLGPQDRLNLFTGTCAAIVRTTGLKLPYVFFGLHLVTLGLLFSAAVALASRLYRTRWAALTLVFGLTLRHAVALGAVNTLEGYMHPRVLAFGMGGLAVAACLAERRTLAVALVAVAAIVHPTTAIWFALWVGVALIVGDRALRLPLISAGALAGVGAAWALTAGPLAGRLVTMDDAWTSVLSQKTYLFPAEWPLSAWVIVGVYAAVIGGVYRLRRHAGVTSGPERHLVFGAFALLAAFLASVPFTIARVAFAVQLQVPRVLWMLDWFAVAYLVWWLVEGGSRDRRGARPMLGPAVAVAIGLLSLARGSYSVFVEHPERAIVRVGLPPGDWTEATAWIDANTPKSARVLASPGHAWRYGTSVRVSARRDTFVDEVKDAAMAMYSKPAALAVADRIRTARDFDQLTADSARALAHVEGLDLLITEARLPLPLLFSNNRFAVYRISSSGFGGR